MQALWILICIFDAKYWRLLEGKFWHNNIEFNFKIPRVPELPILYMFDFLSLTSSVTFTIRG
jgi:hypothetical protein